MLVLYRSLSDRVGGTNAHLSPVVEPVKGGRFLVSPP